MDHQLYAFVPTEWIGFLRGKASSVASAAAFSRLTEFSARWGDSYPSSVVATAKARQASWRAVAVLAEMASWELPIMRALWGPTSAIRLKQRLYEQTGRTTCDRRGVGEHDLDAIVVEADDRVLSLHPIDDAGMVVADCAGLL